MEEAAAPQISPSDCDICGKKEKKTDFTFVLCSLDLWEYAFFI